MATAIKWGTPTAISASLVTTALDGLTNTSESVVSTAIDNTAGTYLYGTITIKLGSITPSAGGSITLRVTVSDGTNTADKAGGDIYTATLLAGASAKIVVFPMIRLYPYNVYLSVVNNSGVTFNAADNDIYYRAYNETT
jgi:hypothetical protein